MACNSCETGFQDSQAIVVSIVKSGTNALLYVKNQGRNTVLLQRILLCRTGGSGGTTTIFLRVSPNPISWSRSSAYLESGTEALFYTWGNVPAGTIVQAQAEYVEIEGRSCSCPVTM